MREIGIGFLGMGNVGGSVARTLLERGDELAAQTGARLAIRRAAVRNPAKDRGLTLPEGTITGDAAEVIGDDGVQILIELIGGESPAGEYIEQALAAGKHVVTGNKELIAKRGPKLFDVARANGAALRFEASVGGGIPVVAPLLRDLRANRVEAIRAIINGTTNFILTSMAQQGDDFSVALAAAQELGYAEPDPTSDVDGHDAAFKLAIMASLAFGARVAPETIPTEGIRGLTARDFQYASELGYVIKLLAIAEHADGGILPRVHPTLLPEAEPLAKVDGVQNAVQVRGDLAGTLTFQGAGAGPAPTTSAVLADVIEIARAVAAARPPAWDPGAAGDVPVLPVSALETRYYLRMTVPDRPGVLATIARVLGENEVSIAAVQQKETHEEHRTAELVIMTHRAREVAVRSALRTIEELREVAEVSAVLRVEGEA